MLAQTTSPSVNETAGFVQDWRWLWHFIHVFDSEHLHRFEMVTLMLVMLELWWILKMKPAYPKYNLFQPNGTKLLLPKSEGANEW